MLLSAYTRLAVIVFRQERARTLVKALSLTHGNLPRQATGYAGSAEKDYQGRLLKEPLSFLKMQFCPQNIVNCINNAQWS